MSTPLYNLIMHKDPQFWSGDEGYVDFFRDRFLEHTEDHLKNQFQSLDPNVIRRLKKLPTLFAVENERADTRKGRIKDLEVREGILRIHYEFDEEQTTLAKGALETPELGLSCEEGELYRSHWALKEADLSEFLEKRSKTLEGVFDKIKQQLDIPNTNKPNYTKMSVLFACNATGKTRLSKLFADQYDEQVLYYNAFTEDLFSWDNENYVLNIEKRSWIFRFIEEQGLDRQIIDNFQKFAGTKLEPVFDFPNSQVSFGIHLGDDNVCENIKISRGEESVFIWALFFTILEVGIHALNSSADDRTTSDFNRIQYIVIDDPVSSMDDTRIISVALELTKLIKKSKNQLKFLITTHHALFFNVLFNARMNKCDRKNYLLTKRGVDFFLDTQSENSPFAYHHVAISEIEQALQDDNIKKYHFNIFRALLEKTANFLGHKHWKLCLQGSGHGEAFSKIIDHYSHDRLSDLECREITDDEKSEFVDTFDFFINKYFKQ